MKKKGVSIIRLLFLVVGVEVRENVVSLCQILSMHEGVEESQIMRNSPIFPTPLEFPVWTLVASLLELDFGLEQNCSV